MGRVPLRKVSRVNSAGNADTTSLASSVVHYSPPGSGQLLFDDELRDEDGDLIVTQGKGFVRPQFQFTSMGIQGNWWGIHRTETQRPAGLGGTEENPVDSVGSQLTKVSATMLPMFSMIPFSYWGTNHTFFTAHKNTGAAQQTVYTMQFLDSPYGCVPMPNQYQGVPDQNSWLVSGLGPDAAEFELNSASGTYSPSPHDSAVPCRKVLITTNSIECTGGIAIQFGVGEVDVDENPVTFEWCDPQSPAGAGKPTSNNMHYLPPAFSGVFDCSGYQWLRAFAERDPTSDAWIGVSVLPV